MERPVRKIQLLEVLSEVYPPGSTIVIEEGDQVMPYHGPPAPVTVSVVCRAEGSLAPAFFNVMSLSQHCSQAPSQLARSSQPVPSSQLTQSSLGMHELRTQLDVGAVVAATRAIPSAADMSEDAAASELVQPASPPPTLVDTDSRPQTPSFNDATTQGLVEASWAHRHSTYVASTIKSSPINTPDHPSDGHDDQRGSSSQMNSSWRRVKSSVSNRLSISQVAVHHADAIAHCD